MSSDLRLIFSPMYSCLNQLNAQHITQSVDSDEEASCLTCLPAAGRVGVAVAAYTICGVGSGIYSLATCPYRLYQRSVAEKRGFECDLDRLTQKEKNDIRGRVVNYMDTHPCNIADGDKEQVIQKAIACYARSSKVYGPIARAWTEYLLEKANREGKKLVFMARDGIPAYKIALDLMKQPAYQKKYPNLTPDRITLAYFSRNVINDSMSSSDKTALFKKYTTQELGIKEGDKCLFVDIGFEGSMIDKIRQLLPGVSADFEYLIAINNKATGFIATKDQQLRSVPSAGNNLGVHWLEDSHQGSVASPSHLVEENGHVYPNTKTPSHKSYSPQAKPGSELYLLKKFSQLGAIEGVSVTPEELETCRSDLDLTLQKIVDSELPLLIKHDTNKS